MEFYNEDHYQQMYRKLDQREDVSLHENSRTDRISYDHFVHRKNCRHQRVEKVKRCNFSIRDLNTVPSIDKQTINQSRNEQIYTYTSHSTCLIMQTYTVNESNVQTMYADSNIQLALLTVLYSALTCQVNARDRTREDREREEEKRIEENSNNLSRKKQSMHDYPTPVSPFIYVYMEQ